MKPIPSVKDLGCPEGFHTDLQGWHSQDPFFQKIFKELQPSVVVEVGSWNGASAVHMASLDPFVSVFCVDTWLGGIDHLLNEEIPPNGLLRKNGYPQLYQQFLHNVFSSGREHRVFPVPNTSTNGARYLHLQGIVADFCYIDGSHELGDVYGDLCAYWPLVRAGGVMAGDDMAFSGVMLDTNRFAIERGLRLTVESDNFWVLKKPLVAK